MVGTYFEGNKKSQFEKWVKRVVGMDDRYEHLLSTDYEEERLDFYMYFNKGFSPWKALQEEYRKYG